MADDRCGFSVAPRVATAVAAARRAGTGPWLRCDTAAWLSSPQTPPLPGTARRCCRGLRLPGQRARCAPRPGAPAPRPGGGGRGGRTGGRVGRRREGGRGRRRRERGSAAAAAGGAPRCASLRSRGTRERERRRGRDGHRDRGREGAEARRG